MVLPPGWEDVSSLSDGQIDILIRIERVGAGLSMVAVTITIASFIAFRKFRTTPNLFLLCACIANVGACIASMIRYDGVEEGEGSSLCQAQAFFFEWFMQSDPWWSFAMSLNVFLVFFCNVNPASFRKYTWLYCLVCYGGPLIPAVTLVSIRGDPRGPIFGSAALWCWISAEWSLVRIYSYYIPIWACILLSLLIYIAVGYHVFHHRNQLKHVTFTSTEQNEKSHQGRKRGEMDSAEEGLTHRPGIYCTAVTEISVTSHSIRRESKDTPKIPSPVHTRYPTGVCDPAWTPGQQENRPSAFNHISRQFETTCTSDYRPAPRKSLAERFKDTCGSIKARVKRFDPVKMAYLRTSFIFAFAVLITWTPSSVNRLYSLWHDGKISFELSVASGCVLPLQGVWNTIIYFTTSWRIVREEFGALKANHWGKRSPRGRRLSTTLDAHGNRRGLFQPLESPGSRLAGSLRPESDDFELQVRLT
ncbi:Cyclic AMP receptor-like protein A [Paramyrothecium foliicola]|nr:Cyclic AMP receptor-like protein A [Paramyrothecium foliicola]